jgi:hypothetical protein
VTSTRRTSSYLRRRVFRRPVTNVFIDGLNLYYGALSREPELRWLNLEELVARLLPAEQVGTIHYFTARVRQGRPGDTAPQRQDAYLRALGTLRRVEVHEGYFSLNHKRRVLADRRFSHRELFIPEFLPTDDFDRLWADKVSRRGDRPFSLAHVEMPEEKVTDVSLGAHLVRDCLQRRCDRAVVVSNDGDFRDAIQIAVDSGSDVRVSNPQRRSENRQLREVSSGIVKFPHHLLPECQFPSTLLDAKGREIHRPREWRNEAGPASAREAGPGAF